MFRRFRLPMLTRLVRLCVLVAPCLMLAGCNYFVILSYLIGGPPSIEPMFAQQTGKDMKDYGTHCGGRLHGSPESEVGFMTTSIPWWPKPWRTS